MSDGVWKICAYGNCRKSFQDATPKRGMKYCSDECHYRAKAVRRGVVPAAGFVKDRKLICPYCKHEFTPSNAAQRYCTPVCREADAKQGLPDPRAKVCVRCRQPFQDTSLKNNQRAHAACSAQAWGIKPHADRQPNNSPRLEARRKNYVMTGTHGRLDQIATLRKFTATWWGRVSELIFATYRPRAKDMNRVHGSRSPYDFEDPDYGKVDVRGAQERLSAHGRPGWQYSLSGLAQGCEHVFLVGYGKGGVGVKHLWLAPIQSLGGTAAWLSPGSDEYRGGPWEVGQPWGLAVANESLKQCLGLPDPVRPPDRFAWMDDPNNLDGPGPGKRGRKGELFYRQLYPASKDMNRLYGSGAPYDFEDPDGTKVNVKASRVYRKIADGLCRWTFSRGASTSPDPDVFSCLCLDPTGGAVAREYRIPASALVGRDTIHIYEGGRLWEKWLVRV